MASLTFAYAQACNLYDPDNKALTYLCAGETCSEEGALSLQCQSGCCHDGKCNADGECAKHQFLVAIGGIVGIFVAGAAMFVGIWWFTCRKQKIARENQQGDDEPMLDSKPKYDNQRPQGARPYQQRNEHDVDSFENEGSADRDDLLNAPDKQNKDYMGGQGKPMGLLDEAPAGSTSM